MEGLAGQESQIEAIFEIEAQVVDDQINLLNPQPSYEHDRQSQNIDIPSKPLTPTQSVSSSPTKKVSPSPIKIPTSTSPVPFIRFPGSNDHQRSPSSERGRQNGGGGGGAPMHWTETNSSGVFGDAEASVSSQPDRLQVHWDGLVPNRKLPPRHVRTRRDSLAFLRSRALSGGNATSPSLTQALNNSTSGPSPLGQLYGTIVVEDEDEDDALSATDPPLARRSRTISNFSEGLALQRRRLSNQPMQRPIVEQPKLESEPETVQELQDEEEEGSPMAENREMRHMLMGLEDRQKRIEGQLERLIATLSQGTQGLGS